MAQYIAFNCALDATTGVLAGTSYAAGAKVAIQLAPPSTISLRVIEWGVSFNGSAAGTPSVCTLAQASAASTCSSAHSTSTIVPVGDNAKTSSLTMGTTSSGYGNGAITTNTTEREFAAAFVGPTSQYEKQFPLGRDYIVLPSKFLQLRINTAATLTAIAYIVFEEC
ncbi:hypothetical protein DEJ49_33495 [Streptomyces venezuelae]|uniref:Uncharacterized protein n=1 Tax=Streptomyces venezuelae TaxID=54571 RepID=A0A5P2CQX7_STRVZ|nr:hypothetical protein [Streptomyces venezuelae]QES45255.1 hypothetical protein DEJ49_33495 [Streptomyces venezuelae]